MGTKHAIAFTAAFASIGSAVWTFWDFDGLKSEARWLLLAVAFALLLVLYVWDPKTVRVRFLVIWHCKKVKVKLAEETIDIAAGDCSWLVAEKQTLEERIKEKGLKVRLLCWKTSNAQYSKAISELAECGAEVEIRLLPEPLRWFRCVLVDSSRPNGEKLLLLEKHPSRQRVVGLFTLPEYFRLDHSIRYIEPTSREFSLVSHLFDQTFQAAEPWDQSP